MTIGSSIDAKTEGRDATESGRLRVVVFTAGPLAPVNRVFFERLAEDSLLELSAIVVDEYTKRKKPLAVRVVRALRQDGVLWVGFKLSSGLNALMQRVMLWLFERTHQVHPPDESYETFERQTGTKVYRVPDIHNEASRAVIQSLRPHLGVIVGGRILRDTVLTIPQYGTLNIHKRKVPEYRGGGPVGYWEILAGERSMGVTIHYATARVDAGPVLAEATIPIEACDTLESLRIKADLLGARVYHDAIRRFALGSRQGVEQDVTRGTTYRAPSEVRVWQLERRLHRRAAAAMALPRWPRMVGRLARYVAVLPTLQTVRKRLIAQSRVPICIFFYHLVANRPANHMCLPLEEFARQMAFLRRYYDLVSLPEAVARVRSGTNDRVAAAITFDDGYHDNIWALEYLRYFQIPASFFVSAGHVRDGTIFEHDRRRGFETARPMSPAELQQLATDGFVVGSHGLYHEDFGQLESATAERALRESRELIGRMCGIAPEHFSFPKGHRENITAESFELAMKHYTYVYSAFGGYCFPHIRRRHFPRVSHPSTVLELAMLTDGYMGVRGSLSGNAWGVKDQAAVPYSTRSQTAAPQASAADLR